MSAKHTSHTAAWVSTLTLLLVAYLLTCPLVIDYCYQSWSAGPKVIPPNTPVNVQGREYQYHEPAWLKVYAAPYRWCLTTRAGGALNAWTEWLFEMRRRYR